MKNLQQMIDYIHSKGRSVTAETLKGMLKAYTPVHTGGISKLYDDSVIEELLPNFKFKKSKQVAAVQLELETPDAPEVPQLDRIEALLNQVVNYLALHVRQQAQQD